MKNIPKILEMPRVLPVNDKENSSYKFVVEYRENNKLKYRYYSVKYKADC